MSRRTVSLVAALAVFGVAAVLLFTLKPFATKAPVPTTPGSLTVVTPQTLADADRPTVLVITGANCGSCGDVLKQLEGQVAKHPGVNFAQGDAQAFGVPEKELPVVAVVVPNLPVPSYMQPKFTSPRDFDGFIKQRVEYATQEAAAVTALLKVQEQLEAGEKPFAAELKVIETNANAALAPIRQRADEAVKDLKAQADEINGRLRTALGTLPKEQQDALQAGDIEKAVEIQGKIDAIAQPFKVEMVPVRAKINATLEPFREEAATAVAPFAKQAEEVKTRRNAALKDLDAELAKAQDELERLLDEHQQQ